MIGSPDVLLSENADPARFSCNKSPSPSLGSVTPIRSPMAVLDTNKSLIRRELNFSSSLRRGRLVIVEGNIGVGKTTLTKKLAADLDYKVFLEPSTDNPFLEKFYADPHKYALKLQLWILRQRYLSYVSALQHIISTGQGVILDRSVYSDCVFASVCHKEGFISDEGYLTYQYWRGRALENLPLPHVTIFLDAKPQVCHDRIHLRARECESGMSLDYLQKLHHEYVKFINEIRCHGSQVLAYDWSTFKDEAILSGDIKTANRVKWTENDLPSIDKLTIEFPIADE